MKQLPRVATPEHSITLPAAEKKIKIRPFLAQEEKILLMALEGGKEEDIKDALKQIITNCILTKGIDVETLANIDVETIFIELRKRSVSETVELAFDLREMFDCGKSECPETYKTKINLGSLEIKNLSNEKKVIMLDENVGVVMRPPSMNTDVSSENKTEALFEIIAASIKEVFDDSDVTPAEEFDKATLTEWISTSFQHKHLEEAITFLTNQPYYYKEIEVTCGICGMKKTQEAKGLVDFFI